MTSGTAISVAMATYNGERFLQEQLDSLVRQTLLPIELVVCDDGSTDSTVEILRRFVTSSPFPVRLYQNETRLGPGFNFLSALARCAGDLVAFCDQDDVWQEPKLRICADAMRDPSVALVSHSAAVLSPGPAARRWRYPDHHSCVWRGCGDFAAHQWELLGFSVMLRRAVLQSAHLPEYSSALSPWCAHDVWATASALSCGQVVLLPDELALHRWHEENATLRPPAKGLMRIPPIPSELERGVQNFAGLAEFLRYAASFCDQPARRTFYEYVAQVERSGRLWAERAQLHRTCGNRWAAIRMFAGMLAKGDYARRGLGAKALARDALLAALWSPSDN